MHTHIEYSTETYYSCAKAYFRQLAALTRKEVHCFSHCRDLHGHKWRAVLSQIAHLQRNPFVVGPLQRPRKRALRTQTEYAPEPQATQKGKVAGYRIAASKHALRYLL